MSLQREADALAAAAVSTRRSASPRVERDLRTEQLRQITADARRVGLELGNTAIKSRSSKKKPRRRDRCSKRAWWSCTSSEAPVTCGCSQRVRFERSRTCVSHGAAVAALDRHRAISISRTSSACTRRMPRLKSGGQRWVNCGTLPPQRAPPQTGPRPHARSSSSRSIGGAISLPSSPASCRPHN